MEDIFDCRFFIPLTTFRGFEDSTVCNYARADCLTFSRVTTVELTVFDFAVGNTVSGHHRTVRHRALQYLHHFFDVAARSAFDEKFVLVRYAVRRPRFDVQKVHIVAL